MSYLARFITWRYVIVKLCNKNEWFFTNIEKKKILVKRLLVKKLLSIINRPQIPQINFEDYII